MKRLLAIATLLALAAAKPELYKEKEDFQYSRSSSDEGSKSGFYGAQRGNMGGNYERAHNMDGLAQNQMSGLVRQVEGELGDGSNTRTGSVFTSSNSRGIYGSGKYDLSNLQGRNFQEGSTYGDSQSHSSLSSHHSSAFSDQASHSAGYHSQSIPYRNSANYHQRSSDLHRGEAYDSIGSMSSAGHNSGYHRQAVALQIPENHDQLQQASSLHSGSDNAYDSSSYGYNHGSHVAASHDTRHISHSGYHSQSEYDQSNLNQQTSDSNRARPTGRLIVATPVRVYGRPGQRVAIPVAAQMYDGTHSASTVDQNAINSEAEVLNKADEHVNSRPTTNSKHYESSYSYRKQWEKHSTSPEIVSVGIPTENPFSDKNSELHDISQTNKQHHSTGSSSSAHTNSAYGGYHSNSKMSSASAINYQSAVDSQHSSSDVNSNTHRGYNLGNSEDSVNGIGSSDSRPKSYQSSYSYHKSWERQGDPYVIQPDSGTSIDHESQRLTAASNRHSGHVFNSHGSEVECDENGYSRKARSVPTQFDTYKNIYDDSNDNGQQTQQQWTSLESIGQETQQFNKLEDLGQQTQHFDKIEDLGQQTQKKWDKLEDYERQPNRWDGLEDLGQQTQNKWDNLQDLGQQTQNHWNFQEHDHSQNKWGDLEDQQSQNNWDTLGQQTDDRWDKLHVGQSQQTDMGQQTQDSWNTMNLVDFGQQTQQSDSSWIGTGDLRKELETPWDSPLDKTQHQISIYDKNITSQVQNVDLDQNIWEKTRNYEPLDSFHHPIEQQNSDINNQYDQKESNMEQFEQNYFSLNNEQDDSSQQINQPWGVISETDINTKNQTLNPTEQSFYTQILDQTNLNNLPYDIENNDSQKKPVNFYFGNSSWNSNSHTDSSFTSLWNKINSFEDGLSSNDLKNKLEISNTYSNSQNDWTSNHQELYHNESSDNPEYSLQKNNFTDYDNLNQAQYNIEPNILHSAYNKTSASTTVTPVSSSTLQQDHTTLQDHRLDIRPLDIGRGDIGPEETMLEDNVTGLEVYNPLHIELQTTTPKIEDISRGSQNLTQGIELDHEKESDINSHITANSENSNVANTFSKDQDLNQFSEFGQVTEKVDTFNQQLQKDDVSKEQTQDLYQEIKYFDNQNLNNSQNTHNSNTNPNNSVDSDNFNQKDDNAWEQNQQTDTVWGQNIDKFIHDPQVQETQMAESFGLNLNQQKEEPRLAEPLKRSNDKQRETKLTSSYVGSQQYHEIALAQDPRKISNDPQDIKQNIQHLQTPQFIENTEDIMMQPNNTGTLQHKESTNEKSRFWSSVGKKISSAKDKVVSWFGKS